MNKKIFFGSEELRKKCENSKFGGKGVYVNFDALNDLPDEYEVVISEVLFDPKNLPANFSDVGGGTWMPRTHIMYEIADACGIGGVGQPRVEPITEEIDINPMLMKPLSDAPTFRRMIVGRRVSKTSHRLTEDGTMRTSSVCTSDYNAWERCIESWSKEEIYTDGYTKAGKFPSKFDNQFKRKHDFDEEMKFAHAKAETKAHVKTIRELAYMETGYKAEDLQEGRLIFAKVRRSREILRMETAARLSAMSKGLAIEAPVAAATELFGQIEDKTAPDPVVEDADFEPITVAVSKRDQLVTTLEYYLEKGLVKPDMAAEVAKMIKWARANVDAENRKLWPSAIDNLKKLETTIPAEGKLTHELY